MTSAVEPRVEAFRRVRIPFPRRRERLHADLEDDVAEHLALEGDARGERRIGARAQRPDVGERARCTADGELLGAHEIRRADDRAVLRRSLQALGSHALDIEHLGDAEVDELHHVREAVGLVRLDVGGEEDVVRLQIAMNDVRGVGLRERARGLANHLGGLVGRERPATDERLGERLALQVLHHDVGEPGIGDAVVVDLHGVLRVDARGGARLDLEATARIGALRELRSDELDGDAGAETLVVPEPDRAHAARSDDVADLVLSPDHLSTEGLLR